ncbi:SAM domain (Sterile alpha motif) [Sphaerochaeta pleomorpha str. Grapes]|uniref:SAM domain (Sterile alpha motif) n=1 Tax=Sphaerochaeta pleomorpha (strain ATCC BAA-1885 / DSM 22778 / Grapes) TaxID=158190 RepID=G8QVU0_SPHPG|nr:SAM domain-containing protein [Sphaerochaeta pleomorpha]AEV30464.1 SAM domain (Sterile alpha motif) [Sphaerochaeta pleomorpha str. Grapes]
MVYKHASSETSEVSEYFKTLSLCEYRPLLEKHNSNSLKTLIGITTTGLAGIGISSFEHQQKVLATLEHTIEKHYQQ